MTEEYVFKHSRRGLRMCGECQYYKEKCCSLSSTPLVKTYQACERFVEKGTEIEDNCF